MKSIRTYGAMALLLSAATAAAWAGERGTTSADFLKIGLGAMAAGVGEACTARPGEINAMFYNPAGLTGMDLHTLSATHLNWIAETRYEALSYARPLLGVGTLGAGVFLLHMPDIPALDQSGASVGMIRAYDLGISFSFAREVSPFIPLDGFNAGASLKFIHRALGELGASGVAADLGLLHRFDRKFSLGLSVLNLGYLSSFDSAAEQLPIVLRAGAGYLFEISPSHQVQALLDVVQPLDNTVRANVGAEYTFAQIVHLRAGYKMGYDTDGFQAGAGITWNFISVDYAVKMMDVFGLTHFVSAAVRFGSSLKSLQAVTADKILQEAEGLSARSLYHEALAKVDEALAMDPANERAREMRNKLNSVLKLLEMPLGTGDDQTGSEAKKKPPEEMTPDELEEEGVQEGQEVQP
ncbi:PorV/PorQ family protein [candidate division FCPU426 bacterium]|nr:PorV/PorQ family protein [candidate division FCPU426 bacterium]